MNGSLTNSIGNNINKVEGPCVCDTRDNTFRLDCTSECSGRTHTDGPTGRTFAAFRTSEKHGEFYSHFSSSC